jgi:molybdopterin-guanine dinucleotide biosynthesis protein A
MQAAGVSLAGFVLAGGKSMRMGQDKALLPVGKKTLLQHVADGVAEAAGNAVIIGDPARYAGLGYMVVPDLRQGSGPLAGMEAALAFSDCEWNLILACDLGNIQTDLTRLFCEEAIELDAFFDCLVPVSAGGRLQPLSAVYRRRCLIPFTMMLNGGVRRVRDAVSGLRVYERPVGDEEAFQNLNTPEEWNRYIDARAKHDRLN